MIKSRMEKFLEDIQSLSWWLGVVAVGVVLNLGTSYLKTVIDRFYERFSATRKIKNKQKADQRAACINAMLQSPVERERFRFAVLHGDITAYGLYTLGFGNMVMGLKFEPMMAIGAITILFALKNQIFWSGQARMLREAYAILQRHV